MTEVRLLPAAEADYQEALAWYKARSLEAAAGFEAAFEVALRQIAEAPDRWTSCDNRHRFYILRRDPYSVVYRPEAGFVLVVALAHSRRQPT
jgi:plasmid stabilization system protein ParE